MSSRARRLMRLAAVFVTVTSVIGVAGIARTGTAKAATQSSGVMCTHQPERPLHPDRDVRDDRNAGRQLDLRLELRERQR